MTASVARERFATESLSVIFIAEDFTVVLSQKSFNKAGCLSVHTWILDGNHRTAWKQSAQGREFMKTAGAVPYLETCWVTLRRLLAFFQGRVWRLRADPVPRELG